MKEKEGTSYAWPIVAGLATVALAATGIVYFATKGSENPTADADARAAEAKAQLTAEQEKSARLGATLAAIERFQAGDMSGVRLAQATRGNLNQAPMANSTGSSSPTSAQSSGQRIAGGPTLAS